MLNKFKSKLKSFFFRSKIPDNISKNFRNLPENYYKVLEKSLIENHFTKSRGYNSEYIDTNHGQKAIKDLIYERFFFSRNKVIPWISSIGNLSNFNVIDVGCGSGPGTSAFAEQVKSMIALDIDKSIVEVCRDRCEILGLDNIEYFSCGLLEYASIKNKDDSIDAIIFYATLEHMSLIDRIHSLEMAWKILKKGGLIIILDTPNCLFFHDGHTSGLPFHHWISDELAYRYVQINNNSVFNGKSFISEPNEKKIKEFIGWGRSMSYHDLEVSLRRPLNQIFFEESLFSYENRKYHIESILLNISRQIRFKKKSIAQRYIDLISEYQPQINKALFQPYLNIVIKKT